ncbi:MAG: hypothetical protein ACRBK7_10330 [Acidimicrobiales bacterium]
MSTSKFKKFGIPGALVVGGITAGSFLAPIGFASAQTDSDSDADSTESTDAESTETESEGRRGRHARAHNHVERSEVLTETLNLTEEEIRQGFQDGKSLADLAGEQGVDVADVEAALVAQASERLDEAVEAGRIDADEAAEKLAEIETKIAEMVNANPGDFQGREGHGKGNRSMGKRGGLAGGNLEALEETLGLSGEEIRAGMVEGKSLSDLAAEQGVSVEDLAATLTAGIEERIDQAVEAGKIDADRAAEAAENIEEKVEEMLTKEFDGERMGRQGNRGEGRRGNGGRFGAPADDATADVEESSYSA